LKADGMISRRVELRQCKYLNNMIEQDHRFRCEIACLEVGRVKVAHHGFESI
jgi:transposase-like protein